MDKQSSGGKAIQGKGKEKQDYVSLPPDDPTGKTGKHARKNANRRKKYKALAEAAATSADNSDAEDEKKLISSSEEHGKMKSRDRERKASVANNLKTIWVPYSGPELEATACGKEYGFQTKSVEGKNPHRNSAGVRYHAVAYSLAQLYKYGKRKILSVYGSPRDLSITRLLNKGVKDDPFEVKLYRPVIVPQDIIREVGEGDQADDQFTADCDAILMNDIYALENEPLTPGALKRLIGTKPLIWIGHRFNGACGTIHGEGAWIRILDGEKTCILSTPDKETAPYVPHDPLDWMTPSGSSKGLLWTTLRTYKDTHVVLFREGAAQFKRAQVNPQAPYKLKEIPCGHGPWAQASNWAVNLLGYNYTTKWIARNIPKKRVLIDVKEENRLRDWLGAKARTPYVFRQMCVNMDSQSSKFTLLRRLFPDETRDLLLNTCVSAFYNDLEAQSTQAENLRTSSSGYISILNDATSNLAKEPETTYTKTFLGVGAMGFFLPLSMAYWHKRNKSNENAVGSMLSSWNRNPKIQQFLEKHKDYLLSFLKASHLIVTEETIKHVGPWFGLGPWIGRAFYLSEFLLKMTIPTPPEARIPHIAMGLLAMTMHEATIHTPFWVSCLVHFGWNCMFAGTSWWPGMKAQMNWKALVPIIACIVSWLIFRRVQGDTAWTTFKHHFHEQSWVQRTFATPSTIAQTTFPLTEGFIGSASSAYFKAKPLDEKMEWNFVGQNENEWKYDAREEFQNTLWFLPTNVPWYRAGRTDANLMSVALARLAVEPPMDPIFQDISWSDIPLYINKPVHEPEWAEDMEGHWIANFQGYKKRRAQQALVQRNDTGFTHTNRHLKTAEIMVKTDEILFKVEKQGEDTWQPMLKPRAIVNIAPIIQAEVGPDILLITDLVKKQWGWKHPWMYEVDEHTRIYVTYGGDATDKKLTKWMRLALTRGAGEASVVVCGDDSLVVAITKKGMRCFEGDASMYDQSQSYGPLWYATSFYKKLGLPKSAAKILRKTYASTYVAKSRDKISKFKISHPHRPMRATGGADTTLGNTIIMGTAWIRTLEEQRWKLTPIEKGFRYLGFDMKMKIFYNPTEVTFLKGMWYWAESPSAKVDLTWSVLPSRFLKIGKSLTDPRTIYRTKNLDTATKQFIFDLGRSMEGFLPVPFVRTFILEAKKLKQIHTSKDVTIVRVTTLGTYAKHRIVNYDSIYQRYDTDEEDVRRIEKMITGFRPGTFLEHPLFFRMALKDYN